MRRLRTCARKFALDHESNNRTRACAREDACVCVELKKQSGLLICVRVCASMQVGFRSPHDKEIPLLEGENAEAAWKMFSLRQARQYIGGWSLEGMSQGRGERVEREF